MKPRQIRSIDVHRILSGEYPDIPYEAPAREFWREVERAVLWSLAPVTAMVFIWWLAGK